MTALSFAVRRRDPELVRPAGPTPRETKRLSDIDYRDEFRSRLPIVFFYRGDCPVGVIRRALGEALVPYYPLAGRLREVEGRRLVVDCTGEGVLFVEADADVRLAQLEAATGLRPPFPCMDQLLFDIEGSNGVVNCPLLLIQVTRLLCGGFVFAFRMNHVICDGTGITQFLSAVAELARGLPAPTVSAAWSRELLEARSAPPNPACPHPLHVPAPPPSRPLLGDNMVLKTFTFSRDDVAALKKALPPHLRDKATTFDALAAAAWRVRTAALELPPDDDGVVLGVVANFRSLRELGLPAGYYGNACIALKVQTTAGTLLGGSFGDAVELVREAKAAMTAENMHAVADLRGRPRPALANQFFVSDVRHAGVRRVDFGCGEPVYGGPADSMFGATFLLAVRNGDGEHALAMPMVLPQLVMDRFTLQVEMLLASLVVAGPEAPQARL